MLATEQQTALPSNKQRALRALLASTTFGEAAAQSGLHERTIRRWLTDDPAFAKAYHDLQGQALQETLSALYGGAVEAVTALRAALGEDDANLRVRAASRYLDQLARFVELGRKVRETDELEARLELLEAERDGYGEY